jgi:hypothetical protein
MLVWVLAFAISLELIVAFVVLRFAVSFPGRRTEIRGDAADVTAGVIDAGVCALTQQEMESKRQAAAQRNNLRGVEKWDHGKKYTDYMPAGQSGSSNK